MTWFALGALALLLVFLLLRGFANAPVAQVRKAVVTGAAVIGGALVLAFLLTGRGAQALWWGVLFGPALWRAYQSWRLKRVFAGRPGGAASSVETRWLTMRLDHASGTMAGEVRGGRFAGRALAELTTEQCLVLLAELAEHDPDGVPLIEAWLDRADPAWREAAPAPPASGPMGRAEALEVLGLGEGAGEAEIRAAHRRLMQAAHPDRGGSDWLAARLNEARDVLLGRGRAPGG